MLSQAVILVGGQGSRLQPLTYYLPKPMLPVLNHPFLEHTIAYLKQYGVSDITLALSYLAKVIKGHLGNGAKLGVPLKYAVEDTPLGTAGAVKNAEPHLKSTFAVLNGDIFTNLDLSSMLTFHRQKRAVATIALAWIDNPCAFGVVETENDGRVRCFIEKPSPERVTTHWINAGIYILEPEVLRHIPRNSHHMFERGLFPCLLEQGEPVYGYCFRGYWLDMGTPEKYLRLNCDLLLAKATSYLCPGIKPDSVYYGRDVIIHPKARITGPVLIGDRCQVDEGARLVGPVVLGEDCHIGEGATLEQALLWPGVSLGAGVSQKQCIICHQEGNEQVINCLSPRPR